MVLDALFAHLGASACEAVRFTFECMAVAETVLAETGEQRATFALLQPTRPLLGKALSTYRAHCCELIERVQRGEDTRPATDAEVLCALLDGSLVAPPTAALAGLAEELFSRVFGELPAGVDAATTPREAWPGERAESLAELRRRFSQKWRSL